MCIYCMHMNKRTKFLKFGIASSIISLYFFVYILYLLDGTVVVTDVPPVLNHGDDERAGQQDRQDGRVLVPALIRVLLLLEGADSEVRL